MAERQELILKCRYYNGEKANVFFQEYIELSGNKEKAHQQGMTDDDVEDLFTKAVLFDVERCWIEKRLKIYPESVDDADHKVIAAFRTSEDYLEDDTTPSSLMAQYWSACHSPLYKQKIIGRYGNFEVVYDKFIASAPHNTEAKHVVPTVEPLSESMIKLGKKGQYELVFPE